MLIDELLVLTELTDELSELADWLDQLDELGELDEDDRSSIDRIRSRSPESGPGNWRLPVWKFSTAVSLASPDERVSRSVAEKS